MHDFLLFGCMIKQTESASDRGRVIASRLLLDFNRCNLRS